MPHSSRNSSQHQIPIRVPSPSGPGVTQTSLNQDSPQRCIATRIELNTNSLQTSHAELASYFGRRNRRDSQGINPNRLLWQNGSESAVQELQIPVLETGNHGPSHIVKPIPPKRKPEGSIASKGWDRDPSLYSWRSNRALSRWYILHIPSISHQYKSNKYPINIPSIFCEDPIEVAKRAVFKF